MQLTACRRRYYYADVADMASEAVRAEDLI